MKFILIQITLTVFCIPIQAHTLGRQTLPELLQHFSNGAKTLGAALIFPAARKKIKFEDTSPLTYESAGQKLAKKDRRDTRSKNFAWEEYYVLEERYEEGDYLTPEELRRLNELKLEIKNHDLQAPGPISQPVVLSCPKDTSYTAPGTRMAGCGASTPAETPSNRPTEQAASNPFVPSEEDPLAQEIQKATETGVLDLSRIEFTPQGIRDTLTGLIEELASRIHTILLRQCNLTHTPPDFTRFTALKHLDLSENKLATLGKLPISLEDLIVTSNQLNSLPDDLKLRKLDARFNQLHSIPTGTFQEIDLTGNPIDQLPEQPLAEGTQITVDNRPDLISSSSRIGGLISFSHMYPDEILAEQLYLGGLEHVGHSVLEALSITHIVNCANEQYVMNVVRRLPPDITVHNLRLDDANSQAIDLRKSAQIVHEALQNSAVLINCRQGISRSATVTIAYLMLYQGEDLMSAIGHVKACRPTIQPNPGFMRQLVNLEMELRPEQDRKALIQEIKDFLGLETDAT